MTNRSALLRLAAWVCIALLAILSLLPADGLTRTSFGGHVEHATAYAGATVFLRVELFTKARVDSGCVVT